MTNHIQIKLKCLSTTWVPHFPYISSKRSLPSMLIYGMPNKVTCPKTKKKEYLFWKLCHQKGLESTWEYVWKSIAVHFDTSVVYSILYCAIGWTPLNLNFSSRNPSIDRLIRWCCIELHKIHYTSSSRIIQLLLLFKEDCFDKTANILLVVVYVSPTLPTWNRVHWMTIIV